MHGQISQETLVAVPASVVWEVYRGLELGKLVDQLLPDVIGRVEVVEGDGGVGTVVKLTFPPGTPGTAYMKEKFVKIDDERRVKETEVIEGGAKDLGFHLYRVRLEIIEKDAESSAIRSSVEYEIDDKLEDIASQVTTEGLETMAQVIGRHLVERKGTAPVAGN